MLVRLAVAVALSAGVMTPQAALAAPGDRPVTFTRDVTHILQR
jgi:hypothetical protein